MLRELDRRVADIRITRSGEFMVAHVSGETEEGAEFVDRVFPGPKFLVIDYGRIVIPVAEIASVIAQAEVDGLTVAVDEVN